MHNTKNELPDIELDTVTGGNDQLVPAAQSASEAKLGVLRPISKQLVHRQDSVLD